jgi:hypothetical protein
MSEAPISKLHQVLILIEEIKTQMSIYSKPTQFFLIIYSAIQIDTNC